MGWLEGALRIMPAWQTTLWGHTIDWGVLIPMSVPLLIIFGGATLWPFLEQWVTGDKREHHINDRPRNAPTRTAVGMAAAVFYGVLLLLGANDLIADHLQIPLYTITWFGRVGIFVLPAVAYIITKRVCIGLQLKDREMLDHGPEIGMISQLPSGAFVEANRPLTEDERPIVGAKKALPRFPAAGVTDENGIPSPATHGATGRLRARLNNVFTEDIHILAQASAGAEGDSTGNGHPGGGSGYPEVPPGHGGQAPGSGGQHDEHSAP